MADRIAEATATSARIDDLVAQIELLRQEISSKVEVLSLLTLISGEDYLRRPEAVATLGGEREVKIAVWNLYDKILRDPILAPYFTGANLDNVRRKQVQMFLALLGVGDYEGPSLFSIHNPHEITGEAFNHMIEIVDDVLRETQMDPGLRRDLVNNLRGFKSDVVSNG